MTTPIIRLTGVHHTYNADTPAAVHALRGVDLDILPGEYVVILGHNGCGKSTLAKHLNALLLPTEGDVVVNGWNTREQDRWYDIRATVGMVFQTPDNQFVATIVEEDIAFGPENLNVPRPEIVERVDWALERVDMTPFRHRPPHLLSGGQKQRICVAGVLAMRPQVLVLDEATAMLDPLGRREVLDVAHRLNREDGVTVVAITHFMEEALDADRVVVMEAGQIVMQGTPREVFSQVERLRELSLDVPQMAHLAALLHQTRPDFPADTLSVQDFVGAVRQRRVAGSDDDTARIPPLTVPTTANGAAGESLIQAEGLVHYYMRGTPLQVQALFDVNMAVRQGEVLGIIGHTGSGKSTIVQHFNGLLDAHAGRVTVLGQDLRAVKDIKTVRRRVGLVFQSPEAQLFENYVGDDIAYGPRNLKLSREEVRERVRRAMTLVGLDFEGFKDRLTFSLSGGEMRRVALAGVLALEPDVLILDEPTAGLDPRGREMMIGNIVALRDSGVTLVLISHNMEELARVCDRLYVVSHGRTVLSGTPREIFAQADTLHDLGLGVPAVTDAMRALLPEAGVVLTVEQAAPLLQAALA